MSCRVVIARTVGEAIAVLEAATEHSRVLAGGTDLMVEWRHGAPLPDLVVDVSRVGELRGIRADGDELWIGATTTCAELARTPLARARADLLVLAAEQVGAAQIQARATIGGNLGTASPAADLIPALVALDARVRLRSARGARSVAIVDFVTGYRRTERQADELIEAVLVPPQEDGERRAFRKVGTRRAQSISKLVVAAAVVVRDGLVTTLRAAAGSVAPRTVALTTLCAELEGQAPTPARIHRAVAASVRADVAPIDDVRSTAAYRRAALARILRTMLAELTRDRGPEDP